MFELCIIVNLSASTIQDKIYGCSNINFMI